MAKIDHAAELRKAVDAVVSDPDLDDDTRAETLEEAATYIDDQLESLGEDSDEDDLEDDDEDMDEEDEEDDEGE